MRLRDKSCGHRERSCETPHGNPTLSAAFLDNTLILASNARGHLGTLH